MSNSKPWFSLEVDRDFYFNTYGEGKPRLYFNPDEYVIIHSGVYDPEENVLKVTDAKGEIHILNNDPDHKLFNDTIYTDWQIFDKMTFSKGSDMEDRNDYEPWMYNSLQSLAYDLNAFDDFKGIMYYGKQITVE